MILDNTLRKWTDPRLDEIRCRVVENFSDLGFNEKEHTYTLNGKEIPSVSSMVERFVIPFDAKGKAKSCSEKNFSNPESPYFMKSPSDIERMWEENALAAAERGTEAHAFGESLMHYLTGNYEGILPGYRDRLVDGRFVSKGGYEDAIARFWLDMPDTYFPILSETKVYGCSGMYAGTFDLLVYSFYPGREGLVMYDYKTNSDLYKNFRGQRMRRCLGHLLDTPKNHYEVQQALYEQALLEIGLEVIGKRLVWIKDSGEYELVRLKENVREIVVGDILDELNIQ